MNIVVLGAGAIGSLFGALLSKKNNVLLIGRMFHVNAIRKNGLSIDGKTQLNVNVSAKDSVNSIPFSVCLLYTSPSPRDRTRSRMPSSA